jgi:transposase-like protein
MPRPAFPRTVLEFQKRFAAEEACLEYLIASRWSEGFVCPRCGSTDAWWKASRRLFECKACRYQASVTAGTIMHRSRMPLRLWFWAAYLVTTHTPGLSARQFARQLDLHYETAFQMLHKLRAAMVREGRERLRGTVEVDEAYIGGARSGKGGRGAYGKVLVAGAVEVRGQKMGRIRLGVVRGASADQLVGFVKAMVEEGSTVVTDAWKGYASLGRGGYQHEAQLEGTPERAPEILPHIHLIFSNLKTWLLGTHHGSVRKQHLQAYLNEFTFRFNRRVVPMAAFQTVLGLIGERQGPTYAGLYGVAKGSDAWRHPNPTCRMRGR